jgi:hypothetical protein
MCDAFFRSACTLSVFVSECFSCRCSAIDLLADEDLSAAAVASSERLFIPILFVLSSRIIDRMVFICFAESPQVLPFKIDPGCYLIYS